MDIHMAILAKPNKSILLVFLNHHHDVKVYNSFLLIMNCVQVIQFISYASFILWIKTPQEELLQLL